MTDQPSLSDKKQDERVKALFERARKGVLKNLDDCGGKLTLSHMHDFSLKTYFIQHQRFSELMETLVESNLVSFDWNAQEAVITEAGKEYYRQEK